MDIYELDRKSSKPPLHVHEDDEFGLHLTNGIGIMAKVGPLGPPDDEDRANAAMLVHCRNSFMEALAALKKEADDCHRFDQSCEHCDRLRELISRLEKVEAGA